MCLMYSGTLASNSEQEKTTEVEERHEWSPSQAKQMPSKYPPPCASLLQVGFLDSDYFTVPSILGSVK